MSHELPALLTTEQTAPLLGLTAEALDCRRKRQQGPPFVRIGRLVRYRPADVAAWVDELARAGTDESAV